MIRKQLVKLNSKEYEHHMDRYLLKKLEATPASENFCK